MSNGHVIRIVGDINLVERPRSRLVESLETVTAAGASFALEVQRMQWQAPLEEAPGAVDLSKASLLVHARYLNR